MVKSGEFGLALLIRFLLCLPNYFRIGSHITTELKWARGKRQRRGNNPSHVAWPSSAVTCLYKMI